MADADSLRILFEDQHLIVLSKPPGLLSQGESTGEENLVDYLRKYFGRHYVGLVHRLDRNTSGLMVVAKRSKSADRLSQQLKAGDLVRKYHAILWGELSEHEHWEHWLLKNEATNEVRTVPPGTAGAKLASLQVRALKKFSHPKSGDVLTYAEFELETGRGHQIRAQSAAMHHFLIGDSKYGNSKSNALFHRPALHSCYLSFLHPISKEKMTFSEPYPSDWEALHQSLN